MNGKTEIKVGCCGFVTSQQEYFRLLGLIEIQITFYQPPKLETAQKWSEAAPPGFEFAMKAWQLITHEPTSPTYRRLREKLNPRAVGRYGNFRPTKEVMEAWNRTSQFTEMLKATWVVFQCPASFLPSQENVKNMRAFFNQVDRKEARFAWEPRGHWPEDLILQLCKELNLVHCVDPFKNRSLYGDVQYFRLHGITGYGYQYTDEELKRLLKWAEEKPTYVLFNNKWMKEDALRFMKLHGGRDYFLLRVGSE